MGKGDKAVAARQRQHQVRPRVVWTGLGIALIGAVLAAVGIMADSVTISLVGAAVTLVGAGVGWAGGALYDAVPAAAFGNEIHRIASGQAREGIVAGQMVDDPVARRAARRTAERTARIEQDAARWRGGSLTGPAGAVMLLVALVLVLAQWSFVHDDVTGRLDSYGETITATILGLAGLRCVSAARRHRIASTVAMVAGVAIVLQGVLVGHDTASLAVLEIACGAVAIGCGLVSLLTVDH
jgi:hypothetical protein